MARSQNWDRARARLCAPSSPSSTLRNAPTRWLGRGTNLSPGDGLRCPSAGPVVQAIGLLTAAPRPEAPASCVHNRFHRASIRAGTRS